MQKYIRLCCESHSMKAYIKCIQLVEFCLLFRYTQKRSHTHTRKEKNRMKNTTQTFGYSSISFALSLEILCRQQSNGELDKIVQVLNLNHIKVLWFENPFLAPREPQNIFQQIVVVLVFFFSFSKRCVFQVCFVYIFLLFLLLFSLSLSILTFCFCLIYNVCCLICSFVRDILWVYLTNSTSRGFFFCVSSSFVQSEVVSFLHFISLF